MSRDMEKGLFHIPYETAPKVVTVMEQKFYSLLTPVIWGYKLRGAYLSR